MRTFLFDLSHTSNAVLTIITHSRGEAAFFFRWTTGTIFCHELFYLYATTLTYHMWQQRHKLHRIRYSHLLGQLNRRRQCIVCPYRQLSSVYLKLNDDNFPRFHQLEKKLSFNFTPTLEGYPRFN